MYITSNGADVRVPSFLHDLRAYRGIDVITSGLALGIAFVMVEAACNVHA